MRQAGKFTGFNEKASGDGQLMSLHISLMSLSLLVFISHRSPMRLKQLKEAGRSSTLADGQLSALAMIDRAAYLLLDRPVSGVKSSLKITGAC